MAVLKLIYHQFFFTTYSLGSHPTTSQLFWPLAVQPLVLVATAIYCALSEYTDGKKATVIFSQDKYLNLFCPSMVIIFTPALINHRLVGCFIPLTLGHNSANMGTPQSILAFLILQWPISMSCSARFLLFQCSSTGIGTPHSAQSGMQLFYFISCFTPSFSSTFLLDWQLLNPDWHSLVWIVPWALDSMLHTSSSQHSSNKIDILQSSSVHLCIDWCSSIGIGALYPFFLLSSAGIDAPHSPSVLLYLD